MWNAQISNTLKHTAYHEAGHAVIGRVIGLPCGEATIIPNEEEGEAGYHIVADPFVVAHFWEERGRYRDLSTAFRGRILTYMAGAEAETELLGHCGVGDGDDRYQIELMAASGYADLDDKWERRESRMRSATRSLVRRHRDKIERVAKALLKHRTLEPGEIAALM